MNAKLAPPHKIQINMYILLISICFFILLSLSELFFKSGYSNEDSSKYIFKFFDKMNLDPIIILSLILNNQLVMFFLIVIVFNYFNIYKSFMLLTILSLSHYFSSLLKLAYMSPRPYFFNQELKIYYCEMGYGFPSTQVFSMVSFYLGLWRVLFESKTKKNTNKKQIAFVLFLLFITIITVTMLLNFTHYYTQIISSFFLGVCLYVIVFEVFRIDLNCGKEFYYIIKFKLVYYFLIYLALASIPIGLYFQTLGKTSETKQWTCKGTLGTKLFSYDVDVDKKYKDDSLLLLGYFLGNIFIIVGVRLELIYLFKSNYPNWINFNFRSNETVVIDDTSALSYITITKDTKWNKTDNKTSMIRLIVILIIVILCFSPYFGLLLVKFQSSSTFYYLFIFQMFLPISICVLWLFYFSKIILKNTELINTTLFTMIDGWDQHAIS